jgi:hypothetical protein
MRNLISFLEEIGNRGLPNIPVKTDEDFKFK